MTEHMLQDCYLGIIVLRNQDLGMVTDLRVWFPVGVIKLACRKSPREEEVHRLPGRLVET